MPTDAQKHLSYPFITHIRASPRRRPQSLQSLDQVSGDFSVLYCQRSLWLLMVILPII